MVSLGSGKDAASRSPDDEVYSSAGLRHGLRLGKLPPFTRRQCGRAMPDFSTTTISPEPRAQANPARTRCGRKRTWPGCSRRILPGHILSLITPWWMCSGGAGPAALHRLRLHAVHRAECDRAQCHLPVAGPPHSRAPKARLRLVILTQEGGTRGVRGWAVGYLERSARVGCGRCLRIHQRHSVRMARAVRVGAIPARRYLPLRRALPESHRG